MAEVTEIPVLSSSSAQVVAIPIRLVRPHPRLASRFRYEVHSLAALIRAAVDADTPNGQLEPGWVVPSEDGQGYDVYIGVRRYHALRLLYEETRDERFAVFNAYVDSKEKSLLDLFLRAKKENEDAKGERLGLSVLEHVFGLQRIMESVSPEGLDNELKRLFALADKLNEQRLKKLYQVEVATRFRFSLEHVERVCELRDEKDLYLSAACAAGFGVAPERVERAIVGKEGAYMLKWFGDVFPDYAKQWKLERGGASEEAAAGASEEQLEVHEKEVIIVPCPECGVENMVRLSLKAEATRLSGDPNGERVTATPDAVVMFDCTCYRCPRKFRLFIKPLGGRSYAAETSLSSKFREPRKVVEAVDLRVDFKEKVWQKIVEGKIVGVIRVRGRTKK